MGKTKQYDLEGRTLKFSKDVISLVNNLSNTLSNNEISKQLVRSAGSVGAIILRLMNPLVKMILFIDENLQKRD